jgi:hypothetical protein
MVSQPVPQPVALTFRSAKPGDANNRCRPEGRRYDHAARMAEQSENVDESKAGRAESRLCDCHGTSVGAV